MSLNIVHVLLKNEKLFRDLNVILEERAKGKDDSLVFIMKVKGHQCLLLRNTE